jgi:hypothetical protein
MGRQNYDRTLGGSKHPPWQPPHGDAAALARPQATPTSHPRSGTSSPVWRRAAMGALLASGVLGAGIWLFSGAPEPDHGVMQVQAVAARAGTIGDGARSSVRCGRGPGGHGAGIGSGGGPAGGAAASFVACGGRPRPDA